LCAAISDLPPYSSGAFIYRRFRCFVTGNPHPESLAGAPGGAGAPARPRGRTCALLDTSRDLGARLLRGGRTRAPIAMRGVAAGGGGKLAHSQPAAADLG